MDYTIRIGGQAGQGLQTIGAVLGKLFTRSGFQVFTHQDYMSRIRGGHNYYQVRFADHPVSSSRSQVDILVALDKVTVAEHQDEMAPGGIIIYDSETVKEKYEGEMFLDVPARKIAMDTAGNRLMENTVDVGAILGMLGLGLEQLEKLLEETFLRKGREIVDQNVAAARAGSDYARENCGQCAFTVPADASGDGPPARRMLLDGTSAVGLGALTSGCRFYSAYPMTPSTGVFTFMASQAKKHSLVVEQAEDEIAAINMALGASFAGVRAMTGTAGGGFALMVEGLSLAGMTETPVVIYVGQRPAPATGLPTRTQQGDVITTALLSHGDTRHPLYFPSCPEECFSMSQEAFNLAEYFQTPVFVMTDLDLGMNNWMSDAFVYPEVPVARGKVLSAGDLERLGGFARYKDVDGDGVGYRTLPATS
ncbi:MAG: 2-oxoacid:acceptor oxidoreductase subunit alpha, partial [Actinobacteria bacterium]|nr:2-oxoacid:acceptor oxidoreductase subunit alpha [Actinomycetota bacterium]